MDPSWNAAEAGSAADAAGPGIPLHQGFAAQAAAVHTAATAPGGGPTHYGARLTQARVFDSGYGAAAHGAAPFASAPASPYEGGAFAYGGAPDPAAYGAAPAATPVYGGGAAAWPDVGAGGCHVGGPRGAPRGASGGHHGGAVPGGYQTPQGQWHGGQGTAPVTSSPAVGGGSRTGVSGVHPRFRRGGSGGGLTSPRRWAWLSRQHRQRPGDWRSQPTQATPQLQREGGPRLPRRDRRHTSV